MYFFSSFLSTAGTFSYRSDFKDVWGGLFGHGWRIPHSVASSVFMWDFLWQIEEANLEGGCCYEDHLCRIFLGQAARGRSCTRYWLIVVQLCRGGNTTLVESTGGLRRQKGIDEEKLLQQLQAIHPAYSQSPLDAIRPRVVRMFAGIIIEEEPCLKTGFFRIHLCTGTLLMLQLCTGLVKHILGRAVLRL